MLFDLATSAISSTQPGRLQAVLQRGDSDARARKLAWCEPFTTDPRSSGDHGDTAGGWRRAGARRCGRLDRVGRVGRNHRVPGISPPDKPAADRGRSGRERLVHGWLGMCLQDARVRPGHRTGDPLLPPPRRPDEPGSRDHPHHGRARRCVVGDRVLGQLHRTRDHLGDDDLVPGAGRREDQRRSLSAERDHRRLGWEFCGSP